MYILHKLEQNELPNTECKKIKHLYLDNKQIKKLPSNIGFLTNLLRLELQNNQIEEIPDSIGYLVNLQRLELINIDVGDGYGVE